MLRITKRRKLQYFTRVKNNNKHTVFVRFFTHTASHLCLFWGKWGLVQSGGKTVGSRTEDLPGEMAWPSEQRYGRV